MNVSRWYESEEMMVRAAKVARLSWDSVNRSDSTDTKLGPKDRKLLLQLTRAGSDHSAALRQVVIHCHIKGSRGWWQHFAKYRVGVEMYSSSLMHTGTRQEYTQNMFRDDILPELLHTLNFYAKFNNLEALTNVMPEGYLQQRAVMMSYPAMHSIYKSRAKHRKKEWREFLEQVLHFAMFPELITGELS